jgi:glycosyltransferase involved in cell wall biosynthesis
MSEDFKKKEIKIFFDYQTFVNQEYGGISRYFNELINSFDNSNVINATLVTNNYYLLSNTVKKYKTFFPNKRIKGKIIFLSLINKIYSIYKINQKDFDVFHPTYYDNYFLKKIKYKPFVLTVFDMIHEKFPENFPKSDKTSINKKILADKASKIIAISQSTKDDLISLFNINPSKIEVIYLANSIQLHSNVKINIPGEFILFVGNRDGYKNFNKFIKAVSKVLKEKHEISIVCVGGGEFKKTEFELFIELGIHNRVKQYNLKDNILAEYYSKALAFVFPSLYEGFGIPILEAFACKCPLICSNTSSLPEIAQNGAKYFDPYSEESIYLAIKNVLDDDLEKQLIVRNGSERLKYFSWDKTFTLTKNLYQSIL